MAVSPVETSASFPIVGIGASAGGLEAFEKLFTHLPPDSGMAFVIIQHLDPTHESILTDLLKKFTRMPVTQVKDRTSVEPNCIYVIPPNTDMELRNGVLRLVKPTMPRGLRLPIDHFFRSLATDHGEKVICIILSGTGTDGTLGMKAIKEEGGLAIVESPESARYNGMPMSAINTGLVDLVLPPEKIAQQLMDYVKRSIEHGTRRPRKFAPGISDHLQSIFFMLKKHTGHDFSGYKENTIARRIERRMTVNQIANVEDYLQYLQNSPLEIETLFRELLIGVTSFFRDHAAFENLEEKIIAPLFAEKREKTRQVRVWIPGCSTGEEAYSVAILLHEQMEKSRRPVEIQVFATDIDQAAIIKAREGRYPNSIAADVTPERLKRFFTREKHGNTYQVKRQIRDMVVFAVQSVIKDPPFSKLDLICCRNLMIYLGPELQQKLLSLFHYSLNPGGTLFLGNSETVGNSQKLFRTIDKKWKIFERAEYVSDIKTVLEFSGQAKRDIKSLSMFPEKTMSVRELTEQMLLAEYVPTSVLINERGEMLYIHGHTGRYLEQSTGEASTNILQIAREGLRAPLSTTIRNVSAQKKAQTIEAVSVKSGKETIRVRLSVVPVLKPAAMQGLMLVTFTEIPTLPASGVDKETGSVDHSNTQHIVELEQELKSTREYLQTVIEELETTNEELKSSNEELQSSNEELQSTNEELQTSKEELQSVNEELVTVNTELQAKVDELTFANNDIKNLMENTQVGIIFLDTQFRIRRFTQASKQIVDLIPEDIGRPLKQFVNKLNYERLIQDVQETLKTQSIKEVEVQAEGGNWYLLRIMPYRTVDDQIAGVVLTLADVTQIKQAEEEAQRSEERYRAVVENQTEFIVRWKPDGTHTFVNEAYLRCFGLTYEQAVSSSFMSLVAESYRPAIEEKIARLSSGLVQSETEVHQSLLPNGEMVWQEWTDTAIRDGEGNLIEFQSVGRDITDRKRAEDALRKSEALLKEAQRISHVGNWSLDIQSNKPGWSEEVFRIFEIDGERSEATYETFLAVVHPEDRHSTQVAYSQSLETREPYEIDYRLLMPDGRIKFVRERYTAIRDGEGNLIEFQSVGRDITERKEAEEALRKSEEKFRAISSNTPDHILVQDLDLRYEFVVNPQIGLTEQDMLGKTDHDFMVQEDADNLTRIKKQVLESGQPVHLDVPVRSREGMQGYFEGSYIPRFDSAGKVTGLIGYFKNVTERKQAEEALRKSQTMLEEAQRIAHLGSWEWIAETDMPTWSRELCRILEVDPDKPVPSMAEQDALYTPDSMARMRMAVEKTMQSGDPYEIELERVRKDGSRRWLLARGECWLDNNGRLIGLRGTALDITERKQAEEALRESERKYRLLFENMEEGFSLNEIITDENGKAVDFRILDANPAYERHTGLKPQLIIGKNRREIVPQADPRQIEIYGTVALTGKPETYEYYSVAFDRHLRVHAFCPQHGYFATTFEDITERKRAEEELRQSEEKFRSVFEDTHIGICLVAPDGRFMRVNNAMREIFGYTHAEFKDLTINSITHPDYLNISPSFINKAISGQIVHAEFEKAYIHKDGHIIWGHVSSSITKDVHGSPLYFISHVQDISDRKRAEEALRESQAMLTATLNALPDLLFEVDHDGRIYDFRAPNSNDLFVSPQVFLGKTIHEILPPDAAQIIAQAIDEAAATGSHIGATYSLSMPNGVHWFEISIATKNIKDTKRFIVLARNITDRKRVETDLLQANKLLLGLHETLREQATRDALTGLYNRRYLYETIERELARAKRDGYSVSVVMIDIDHFKEFNDVHGHQAGDEILVALGKLLNKSIRQGDLACRYGGEEFILVMPGAHMEDAMKRAEVICQDFQNLQIEINGEWLSSTVSLGVALYPEHGGDVNRIIKAADLALYQAKQEGRNCVRSASDIDA